MNTECGIDHFMVNNTTTKKELENELKQNNFIQFLFCF